MKGPRCADFTREAGIDPVGTAPTATSWLLLEWPLPWPRDIADIGALAPVREALAGTGGRFQLLVPADGSDAHTVVFHHGDDSGWFTRFRRIVRSVPQRELVTAALELVTSGTGDEHETTDLLVCGHGARDRCCGSLGTALALSLAASGTAIHRTSHLGGHRFAPTGVVLPAGTAWAFLDLGSVERIIAREGPHEDLLHGYRGCVALGSPGAQALEREAFREVGWTWLDQRRREVDIGGGRVRIEALSPSGARQSWEADAQAGRTMPVPECRRPIAEARQSVSEVVLGPITRRIHG